MYKKVNVQINFFFRKINECKYVIFIVFISIFKNFILYLEGCFILMYIVFLFVMVAYYLIVWIYNNIFYQLFVDGYLGSFYFFIIRGKVVMICGVFR